MRKIALCISALTVLLTGCTVTTTPSPGPERTGGGGITPHQQSARIPDASGTGNSAGALGAGPVPGTGAGGETDNAQSASESNGGVPLGQNPNRKLLL